MANVVTRRRLLVLAPGGVAAAAFGGCAVIRGGASHPVLDPGKAQLEGNLLRIPMASLSGLQAGEVLESKPCSGRPDLLLLAPPPGGTWSDLPATINTMPYQLKATSRSNDLRSDGMHLTIVWKPPQFSDWFPKEIPVNFRQKFENDFKTIRAAHPSATYVLSGDEMVAEGGGTKITYKRVK